MKRIENFAKRYYVKNDPAHGLEHMYMSEKIAMYLAKEEKADINICRAAALLHDILQTKHHEAHETHAVPIIRKFLKSIKLDKGIIEQVLHAVECHSTSTLYKARTKEAKIIYDADKLQSLGCYGFVKTFTFRITAKGMTKDEAVFDSKKLQDKVIKHLQTKTAKRLIKEQHEFMKHFYEFYNEFRRKFI